MKTFVFDSFSMVYYSVKCPLLSFNKSLSFYCLIWIRVSKLPLDLEDFVHVEFRSNFRSSFNKLQISPIIFWLKSIFIQECLSMDLNWTWATSLQFKNIFRASLFGNFWGVRFAVRSTHSCDGSNFGILMNNGHWTFVWEMIPELKSPSRIANRSTIRHIKVWG